MLTVVKRRSEIRATEHLSLQTLELCPELIQLLIGPSAPEHSLHTQHSHPPRWGGGGGVEALFEKEALMQRGSFSLSGRIYTVISVLHKLHLYVWRILSQQSAGEQFPGRQRAKAH